MTREETAYADYLKRTGFSATPISTALIDMDGVLYDSMPNHSRAWKRLAAERGWHYADNEFFLYEGMTGAAIIRLMEKRECNRDNVSDDECKAIYAKKAEYFTALGKVGQIQGTARMLNTLRDAAPLKVTAHDVRHGKPDPEPYLIGMDKAGVQPWQSIVIENAPLGVKAGSAAKCFTIGITTGPIPEDIMLENGADIVYPTMEAFADALPSIINLRKQQL